MTDLGRDAMIPSIMERLDAREAETLAYVVVYRESSLIGDSPSFKEIMARLNEVLPVRGGRPAIVSTQQVMRVVEALRAKGYLFDPKDHPELRGRHRNSVPTPLGVEHAGQLQEAPEV